MSKSKCQNTNTNYELRVTKMIRALIETSLVDWDGKISVVLFFDKCNFMCPFCQNWELILHPKRFPAIQRKKIASILQKKKDWIDGVVLSGGEPLVYEKEVFKLTKDFKKINVGVKVDTNGAFPGTLKELIDKRLVDYVAMDIKAPIDERYYIAVGKKINLEDIKESIQILMADVVDYEFRTTCVPGIIDENAIDEIGKTINHAKKWALQVFVPDNAYKEEYRRKLGPEYVLSLQKFLQRAKKYVSNVILRGKV